MPDELRSLPPGLYLIEAIEPAGAEVLALGEKEEDEAEWGVAAALEALETTEDIAHEAGRAGGASIDRLPASKRAAARSGPACA